jgi:hypothetical protein
MMNIWIIVAVIVILPWILIWWLLYESTKRWLRRQKNGKG